MRSATQGRVRPGRTGPAPRPPPKCVDTTPPLESRTAPGVAGRQLARIVLCARSVLPGFRCGSSIRCGRLDGCCARMKLGRIPLPIGCQPPTRPLRGVAHRFHPSFTANRDRPTMAVRSSRLQLQGWLTPSARLWVVERTSHGHPTRRLRRRDDVARHTVVTTTLADRPGRSTTEETGRAMSLFTTALRTGLRPRRPNDSEIGVHGYNHVTRAIDPMLVAR